jgi:2-phosphosulfolactate phosphatase
VVSTWLSQVSGDVRFEWGPQGSARLVPDVACLVVIDVLSFTTTVSVAIERGMAVFPYRWKDESAARLARQVNAKLAVGRRAATPDNPWSLSPAALRKAPAVPRLVLPSPNGSTIAAAAAEAGRCVVAASLRNAAAVGRWLVANGYGTAERPVAVIAAGERWPAGELRPSLEDALGAGAVITALVEQGASRLSPEAEAIRLMHKGVGDVAGAVKECASGIELVQGGFAEDVEVAIEVESSPVVPVLVDGAFADAA